jgi:hypothetical protein
LRTTSKTWRVGAIQFTPKPLVFQVEGALGQHAANLGQHLVEQDRLHQVIVSAALESLDGVLDGRVSRDEQNEGFGAEALQTVEQFEAVDARQLHVAKGHVEALFGGMLQRLLAGSADRHPIAFLRQVLGQGIADEDLIVHHEDVDRVRGRRGRNGGAIAAGACLYHAVLSSVVVVTLCATIPSRGA